MPRAGGYIIMLLIHVFEGSFEETERQERSLSICLDLLAHLLLYNTIRRGYNGEILLTSSICWRPRCTFVWFLLSFWLLRSGW
ncbi:hypothetical protein SCLCIDRAFT_763223 [Scleroderma citrinum Foug A]|uniref:Uncharacterized protein n=1 Tax=Scleroderma citrinum Foug A TaxID=1036808 RepID=A0A0C3E463_9AGAM|nr:hypothetical protein SCLCIDRAFT_763223 [Scleroderma citrinum Foug A]